MAANVNWTPEKETRLLALREKGLSGSEAGAVLGLSKNTCLARAAKLGRPFSNRFPGERLNAEHRLKRFHAPQFSGVPLPKARPMPFPPLNIPFMELDVYEHCLEVMGTGGDGLAIYCGHKRRSGSSYCSYHSEINVLL